MNRFVGHMDWKKSNTQLPANTCVITLTPERLSRPFSLINISMAACNNLMATARSSTLFSCV